MSGEKEAKAKAKKFQGVERILIFTSVCACVCRREQWKKKEKLCTYKIKVERDFFGAKIGYKCVFFVDRYSFFDI